MTQTRPILDPPTRPSGVLTDLDDSQSEALKTSVQLMKTKKQRTKGKKGRKNKKVQEPP